MGRIDVIASLAGIYNLLAFFIKVNPLMVMARKFVLSKYAVSKKKIA
jgi:hypothetical protein